MIFGSSPIHIRVLLRIEPVQLTRTSRKLFLLESYWKLFLIGDMQELEIIYVGNSYVLFMERPTRIKMLNRVRQGIESWLSADAVCCAQSTQLEILFYSCSQTKTHSELGREQELENICL